MLASCHADGVTEIPWKNSLNFHKESVYEYDYTILERKPR